ncbi:MAG: epoxyqueuosine reductase QueH [Candidatus Omnitrophica bacterium]|nr:epoxyqueuosine reductase QueH [Candidatus Omnitrophota bacterium]
MDILLHICCGPCLIYPFGRLKDSGCKISGFYYNPNIYPAAEYQRRLEGVKALSREFLLDVEYPEYNHHDFFQAINPQEALFVPQRCEICWSLRLRKTAQRAKQRGFSAFSTTLLVSPYQDHGLLKQIGAQISRQIGIDFYYDDFRPGFKQAQIEAKNRGIYRQKYCGCEYSMRPEK